MSSRDCDTGSPEHDTTHNIQLRSKHEESKEFQVLFSLLVIYSIWFILLIYSKQSYIHHYKDSRIKILQWWINSFRYKVSCNFGITLKTRELKVFFTAVACCANGVLLPITLGYLLYIGQISRHLNLHMKEGYPKFPTSSLYDMVKSYLSCKNYILRSFPFIPHSCAKSALLL